MSFSVSSSEPVRTCIRRLPLSFLEAAGAAWATGEALVAGWAAAAGAAVAAGAAAGAAGLAASAGFDSAGFDSAGLAGAVVAAGVDADWPHPANRTAPAPTANVPRRRRRVTCIPKLPLVPDARRMCISDNTGPRVGHAGQPNRDLGCAPRPG